MSSRLQMQPYDAAIAGVAESDQIGRVPGKTNLQLGAEAARNALEDAGIDRSEVDGVFTCGIGSGGLMVQEFLGIRPRYMDNTQVGGSSWVIDVEHAMAAIRAGLIEVALLVHGE